MTAVFGIDPGFSGGIAYYNGVSLMVYTIPINIVEFVKKGKIKKRKEINIEELCEIFVRHKADCAYLEQVTAMPGQGVTGMFRFGEGYGILRGVLAASGIKTILVRPQVWKKHYMLTRDKKDSLEKARELFPYNTESFRLLKHDGLAESSLIAKYGLDSGDDHNSE